MRAVLVALALLLLAPAASAQLALETATPALGAALRVQLVVDGEPVVGTFQLCHGASVCTAAAATDARGVAQLSSPDAPGYWTLYLDGAPTERTVDVRDGFLVAEERVGHETRLRVTRVRDGAPVEGALVRSSVGDATTDAAGLARAEGGYTLEAEGFHPRRGCAGCAIDGFGELHLRSPTLVEAGVPFLLEMRMASAPTLRTYAVSVDGRPVMDVTRVVEQPQSTSYVRLTLDEPGSHNVTLADRSFGPVTEPIAVLSLDPPVAVPDPAGDAVWRFSNVTLRASRVPVLPSILGVDLAHRAPGTLATTVGVFQGDALLAHFDVTLAPGESDHRELRFVLDAARPVVLRAQDQAEMIIPALQGVRDEAAPAATAPPPAPSPASPSSAAATPWPTAGVGLALLLALALRRR